MNSAAKANKQDKIYSRFSFWLAISLILNGYASGIPGVSLGSACYIIFIAFALSYRHLRMSKTSAIATLMLVVNLLLSLFDYAASGIVPELARFLMDFSKIFVWWAFICIVPQPLFSIGHLTKWFVRISVILTIYLIIQNIAFYGVNIYLPNIFSFGPLQPYDDGYANAELLGSGSIIRPASFLSESSFLGNYLMLTLVLVLYRIRHSPNKKDDVLCLFFTLGIILTSSTSAIVLLGLIWLFMGWSVLRKHWVVTSLVALCGAAYCSYGNFEALYGSSQVGTAVFYTFDKFNHMEGNVRFGKSYEMLEYLNGRELLTGVGLGNEQNFIGHYIRSDYQYLNSITTYIINAGIIGLSVLAIFLSYLLFLSLRQRNKVAFTLIVIYIIKIFGSGFLFNTYGVLYMFVVVGALHGMKDKTYR